MDDPKAKPAHLSEAYAAQFTDASVADAYAARPPYPASIAGALAGLLPAGTRDVLELGCGTGDLTVLLAPHVAHIDAIDPSPAMLRAARLRDTGGDVRWIAARAEGFTSDRRYGLVVAAESLHWMEWPTVFSNLSAWLAPDARLALLTVRSFGPFPWDVPLRALIARHSTNQDYRPYDLIAELSTRGLFVEHGRSSHEQPHSQSIDDYVRSFHSRNGFSRDRMPASSAQQFDQALRALVAPHTGANVHGTVRTTLVWGIPAG